MSKYIELSMSILTATYVVVTFMMWLEMRRVRLSSQKPNLQVSLEPQVRWGNFFDLNISNIGNVPVYGLAISIEPRGLKTIGDRKLEDINLFKRSIPVFGIGQSLRTFAISYVDFINSNQQKQLTFTTCYKTSAGRKFTQKFNFDLEVYRNMSASSESTLSDVVSEMKDIVKEVGRISAYFEKKSLKKEIASKKDF